MKIILVTVFFDIEDEKYDKDRDMDRFILFCAGDDFWDNLFNIFDEKRYSWDDLEKIKRGYKPIMELETLDLTNIKVY